MMAKNGRQLWRRMVLGAFALIVALPGLGAAVAADDGNEGHTSAGQMKGSCEEQGGTFTDTKDGNLWCQDSDGGQELCDADGQDCHYIPPARWQQPVGPVAGTGGLATADGGGTITRAPAVGSASKSGTGQRVAAREHDRDHDTTTNTGKGKGKHARHSKHGKGRK